MEPQFNGNGSLSVGEPMSVTEVMNPMPVKIRPKCFETEERVLSLVSTPNKILQKEGQEPQHQCFDACLWMYNLFVRGNVIVLKT